MQSMKRLTALVMAAVMVLSLAGCGGSGSTAAQARPQTAPQLQRPVQRPSAPAPTAPAVPETVPQAEAPRLEFLSAPPRGGRPGQPGAGGSARHRLRCRI